MGRVLKAGVDQAQAGVGLAAVDRPLSQRPGGELPTACESGSWPGRERPGGRGLNAVLGNWDRPRLTREGGNTASF